jgi:putative transposase
MQFIKGGFSYRVKKDLAVNCEIWERGYVDHRIRDQADYDRHRAYIRNNPIQAGLAVSANTYPYCSFYPGMEVNAEPQGLKPDFLDTA